MLTIKHFPNLGRRAFGNKASAVMETIPTVAHIDSTQVHFTPAYLNHASLQMLPPVPPPTTPNVITKAANQINLKSHPILDEVKPTQPWKGVMMVGKKKVHFVIPERSQSSAAAKFIASPGVGVAPPAIQRESSFRSILAKAGFPDVNRGLVPVEREARLPEGHLQALVDPVLATHPHLPAVPESAPISPVQQAAPQAHIQAPVNPVASKLPQPHAADEASSWLKSAIDVPSDFPSLGSPNGPNSPRGFVQASEDPIVPPLSDGAKVLSSNSKDIPADFPEYPRGGPLETIHEESPEPTTLWEKLKDRLARIFKVNQYHPLYLKKNLPAENLPQKPVEPHPVHSFREMALTAAGVGVLGGVGYGLSEAQIENRKIK